jgi:hypothetical protein
MSDDRRSRGSRPGTPEPVAAEVESARLLANEARDELRAAGFSDEDIRKLADEFVADHPAMDPDDFIPWAMARRRPDVA